MDRPATEDGQDFLLYEYLLDTGVLNDVHAVAESIADGASSTSSGLDWTVVDADEDGDAAARRIADRLLERSADHADRALDAIVQDARLAAAGSGPPLDFRWPRLTDVGGGGRATRDTRRILDALVRLPFTSDTYAGPYFRKLTRGLERVMAAGDDSLFGPCARVYAKLVDSAPDADGAAESFGSLCEATHVRCLRGGRDFRKTAAAVCLTARCLSTVCRRGTACGASAKSAVRPAVAEFVAMLTATRDRHRGPYAVLCCADPEARWFDRVARSAASRSAFLQCLDGGDRKQLLRTAVADLADWTAEPRIPAAVPRGGREADAAPSSAAAVGYACAMHAAHLLAKMLRYRAVRDMFPVRVSRTFRVHATGLFDMALGFLSANRDQSVPRTLARGMCGLAAAVLAFHAEQVVDSVLENPSGYAVRVLAEAVERPGPGAIDAVIGRESAVNAMFVRKRRRNDGGGGSDPMTVTDSLTRVAVALTDRSHDEVWRLITSRTTFLEEAAASEELQSSSGDCGADSGIRSWSKLMANVRCTPLGVLTYGLEDFTTRKDFDWRDPLQQIMISISCTFSAGRDWLVQTGALDSLDQFVEICLNEAEIALNPDDSQHHMHMIVDVVYTFCASIEGLRILIDGDDDDDDDDGGPDSGTGRSKLAEILHLSYEDFDRHSIARDVLVVFWLRLIEAATHTFGSRVYVDFKLNYQDTLAKLSADNCTEDGAVIVDETTELLTKLRKPLLASGVCDSGGETVSSLTDFLSNSDCRSSGWLQRVRTMIVHADRISGSETVDLIVSFGRRRFADDGRPPAVRPDDAAAAAADRKSDLSGFDATGLRLAMRLLQNASVAYGSGAGLVPEDSAAELERLYGGCVERRRGRPAAGTIDCVMCTLFVASQGSRDKCNEAYDVLLKLSETVPFIWPQVSEEDFKRRAAFGHLAEGLLRQELPEVYNVFKMSGVSWWLLCSAWAADCFWGRLSWPEICRWLCTVVLFPVDYQAFFFVCLAAARKRQWLEAFNLGRFRDTVYQGGFDDFRLADHAGRLEDLAKKYPRSAWKRIVAEFDSSQE